VNGKIIEQEIQAVSPETFAALGKNDLLFLDTSHITQPYGDVLYELLWILPTLKKGVIVCIHDIFLPFDYKAEWRKTRHYTENWVVAAFLYGNSEWEVLFATYYMTETFPELFTNTDLGDPGGSFFIVKT